MKRHELKLLRLAAYVAAVILMVLLVFGLSDAHAKRVMGAHYTVHSTSYSFCSAGATMASGKTVYWGAVANNFLAMKTLIKLDRPFRGENREGEMVNRRYFRVEDRIGSGSELDIWTNRCDVALDWGSRTVGFHVMERR